MQRSKVSSIWDGTSLQRACPVLIAISLAMGLVVPAGAITVLSQGPNTDVYIGSEYNAIEFENPLAGTEVVHGYNVLEWRDADYRPGPPPWYDDWSVSHPGQIDGHPDEIWMRQQGQSIWTNTNIASDAVSIHLYGDSNDGIASVLVDGVEVARLDMGSSPPQTAVVLVRELAFATHSIKVSDLGQGAMGTDVATLGACSLQREILYKWYQPPQPISTENYFYGWNEPSLLDRQWIAADDWFCTSSRPITRIRWWGSHLGWREPSPPSMLPDFFWVTIWTDVPPNAAGDPFSHPGRVLWMQQVVAQPMFAGWDYDPRTQQTEACFMYEVTLPPEAYFCQNPIQNNIYWLSIAAGYVDVPQIEYPWGWKTRPRDPNSPAPDDAVRIFNPTHPYVGMQYVSGEPIWFPTPEQSWDLAFELFADFPEKWIQPPDLSETGIDVNATAPMMPPPLPTLLADDFECRQTGLLTHFTIWGSWYHDLIPAGNPTMVVFTLSLHKDVPAGTQQPYSMPGEVIWMHTFQPGQFMVRPIPTLQGEGWLTPPFEYEFPADFTCWQYDFFVSPDEAFLQEGSPENPMVYWLDVQATPLEPMSRFGWKTSLCHWNDDAVWVNAREPYIGNWNELRYPPQHPLHPASIDLAFTIGSDPIQPQPPEIKWSQPPVPWTPDDAFNGWNELSWFEGPQIAADDWVCTSFDPVTGVHWWGSFLNWAHEVPPLPMPIAFQLAIWTDIPADPNGQEPWSHTGRVIWNGHCPNYRWRFVGWDVDPRNLTAPLEACYKFECELPPEAWFWQERENQVFWLSIAAVYPQGTFVDHPWGWKTVPRLDAQSPDDAVRIFIPTAPLVGMPFQLGAPIFWPTPNESWDLAFTLLTQPCSPTGDVNQDGAINGLDIQCFVDCMLGTGAHPCWCDCGDMDGDRIVTTSDITPYVALLLSI